MNIYERFEAWINYNPHLKGGNTLEKVLERYGTKLNEPEYASSWIQLTFEAYKKGVENEQQRIWEILESQKDCKVDIAAWKKMFPAWDDSCGVEGCCVSKNDCEDV